jgi:adenine-specific DNA methylase
LDKTITNIRKLTNPYKFALAFFALCQSCLVKRPYNLFHRKNLYIRTAEVPRSFGNKTSWDRPFDSWFMTFVAEINHAVFDNGQENIAQHGNALDITAKFDLVYIDPPYISLKGSAVDYQWFYHFLEGLSSYDDWPDRLDYRSNHRRLKKQPSEWTDKKFILAAFDRLFNKYQQSILVVSYRNDGIPAESELKDLLQKYKKNVQLEHYGPYKYALSKNLDSKEILLIGT